MKKLFIFILSLICFAAHSQVSIGADGGLAAQGNYGVTKAPRINGTWFGVADTIARNAIPAWILVSKFTFVYTSADSTMWHLDSTHSPIWSIYSKGPASQYVKYTDSTVTFITPTQLNNGLASINLDQALTNGSNINSDFSTITFGHTWNIIGNWAAINSLNDSTNQTISNVNGAHLFTEMISPYYNDWIVDKETGPGYFSVQSEHDIDSTIFNSAFSDTAKTRIFASKTVGGDTTNQNKIDVYYDHNEIGLDSRMNYLGAFPSTGEDTIIGSHNGLLVNLPLSAVTGNFVTLTTPQTITGAKTIMDTISTGGGLTINSRINFTADNQTASQLLISGSATNNGHVGDIAYSLNVDGGLSARIVPNLFWDNFLVGDKIAIANDTATTKLFGITDSGRINYIQQDYNTGDATFGGDVDPGVNLAVSGSSKFGNLNVGTKMLPHGTDSVVFGIDSYVNPGLASSNGNFAIANQVAANIGSNVINRGIAGTTYQFVSAGDSSMIGRLINPASTYFILPIKRSTLRYEIIMSSTNDVTDTLTCDTAHLKLAVIQFVDSAIVRGWSANQIVFCSNMFFQSTSALVNQRMAYYPGVLKSICAQVGCLFVDNYTGSVAGGGHYEYILNGIGVHANDFGCTWYAQNITDALPNETLKGGTAFVNGLLRSYLFINQPLPGNNYNLLLGDTATSIWGNIGGTASKNNMWFNALGNPNTTGAASGNAIFGPGADAVITSATNNLFAGLNSGRKDSVSSFNTGTGGGTLQSLVSGSGGNTANGYFALSACTTCANVVGVGLGAGDLITTQTEATIIGHNACLNCGTNSTVIGSGAALAATVEITTGGLNSFTLNTTGAGNTGWGFNAAKGNKTGSNISVFGDAALQNDTLATAVAAFGKSNLLGAQSVTNTASYGAFTLSNLKDGATNAVFGYNSFNGLLHGTGNTGIGTSHTFTNGDTSQTNQFYAFVGTGTGVMRFDGNNGVGVWGGTTLVPSEAFSIASTTKAFGLPTMSANVFNNIASPANGGVGYETTNNHIRYFKGASPTWLLDSGAIVAGSGISVTPTATALTIAASAVPNTALNTMAAGTIKSALVAGTPTDNTLQALGAPKVVASGLLTGQTAAVNVVTYTTGAADSTFEISGRITVTAVATDVIQLQAIYTDETGASRTAVFYSMGATSAGLSATGASNYAVMGSIRVKASTTITVSTVLTTGIGSITYNAAAKIIEVP